MIGTGGSRDSVSRGRGREPIGRTSRMPADELRGRIGRESASDRRGGGGLRRGGLSAAPTIAERLEAIFGASPTLLSHLGGTYVKLVSSVRKPPYPPGKYAPLTEVTIDLGQSTGATTGQAAGFPAPGFRARLGSTRDDATVQTPDWWRSEPVFHVDHSKVTRRDVVQAARGHRRRRGTACGFAARSRLDGRADFAVW